MKIPKIIFVDGITGSGKSTISHYIERQLQKNNIKVKCISEHDEKHPLEELERKENETDLEHSKRTLSDYPQKWIDFVNKIKDDEFVYILECYFFMNVMWEFVSLDYKREVTKKYLHNLYSKLVGVDVAVILFYQNDVEKAIRKNWERRGDWWKSGMVNRDETFPFCVNRGLKTDDASIAFYQEKTSICLEVFEELSFRKIKIENSALEWIIYRQKILDFIDIPMVAEEQFQPSYEEYCGYYSGYLIHIKDNRMRLDRYELNLKLIKVGEDEFQIESEYDTYKFLRNEDGKVEALQMISAYGIKHIGLIFKKYDALSLSTEKMLSYCGHYLCEDDGAITEISLDDGILYSDGYRPLLRPLLVQDDRQLNLKDTLIEYHFNEGPEKYSFVYHDLDRDQQFKKFEPLKADAIKLEDHELMPFCGEYWCEVEKLNRKIILENNKLYYTRDDNSRSRLFAIENKIFILADTPIKVIFNSNNDVANFAFHQTNSKVLHFLRVE